MDWKAIPNISSGGNSLASKPVEYWVAAPSVCGYAYDVACEHFAANEKKKKLGSAYNLAINDNNISIFLAAHGGPIAISERELLPEIARGGAGRWVILRVPCTG